MELSSFTVKNRTSSYHFYRASCYDLRASQNPLKKTRKGNENEFYPGYSCPPFCRLAFQIGYCNHLFNGRLLADGTDPRGDWSARLKIAALTGILFISNKVLLVLVITIMGKSGFQQLKRSLFGYASSLAPDKDVEVGPVRHSIGIVMFCLPLISGFLEPYIDSLWPGLRPNLWELQVLGDAMLIGSFFVLGGSFWEKVRALFIRTARVANTEAA